MIHDRDLRYLLVSTMLLGCADDGAFERAPSTMAVAEMDADWISGGPTGPFANLSGLAIGPDGELYAADAGTRQITAIAADGETIYAIGREGDGPLEFRSLLGIAANDSYLAAVDQRLRRVTLLDPTTGRLVTTFPVQGGVPVNGWDGGLHPAFLEDGTLALGTVDPLDEPEGSEPFRVIRYSVPDGVVVSEVTTYLPKLDELTFEGMAGPGTRLMLPFTSRPVATVGRTGTMVTIAANSSELVEIAANADTVRRIRLDLAGVPITHSRIVWLEAGRIR